MNRVILIGRLTATPELKTMQSGISFCNFTVAVDRPTKDAGGNRVADFISCTAWRQRAEFICKYFTKGRRIALAGSMQTRSYDAQDGSRRHIVEVVCDSAEFVDSAPASAPQEAPQAGFTEVQDDDLPF